MFKVLTGEKKRRVISPATITASVAAHLLLLGGLVYASTREDELVDVVCLDCGVLPPLEEEPPAMPLPPAKEQSTPPAPAQPDEPPQAPPPVTALEVPPVVKAPTVIEQETPGVPPIVPGAYDRDGARGPVITPPTTGPITPATRGGRTPGDPYDPGMVEVLPVLERTGLARILERNYPSILRDSRVSGRVVIELVVDEDGVPVPGSARVIEASHPAFGEATLRVADRFRFRPARLNGDAVAVVVTIPIVWTSR